MCIAPYVNLDNMPGLLRSGHILCCSYHLDHFFTLSINRPGKLHHTSTVHLLNCRVLYFVNMI